MKRKSICLLPEITSLGGPAAFQQRFIAEASRQGVHAHFDSGRKDIGAYLVIGAPRRYLTTLISAKTKGVPIVQRLNGMNWIHRVRPSGRLYAIRAEAANFSIAAVRKYLASRIVYQSAFCESFWNRVYGEAQKPVCTIYNGVDLEQFKPLAATESRDTIDLMITEGNLQHGSEFILLQSVELALALARESGRSVRIQIAGNVAENVRAALLSQIPDGNGSVTVNFLGILSKDDLVRAENNADLLFSVEIHPACPNAVIEALACGLPVIGFDTGSLKDIVGTGGIVVPYGADAWKLEKPDLAPLINAALKVLANRERYGQSARNEALTRFSICAMVRDYLAFCFD